MNAPAEKYCQHPLCRAHTAEDLLFMARVLLRHDLAVLASQVDQSTVRCRRQPRKGPIKAPFPNRSQEEQSA